MDPLEYIKTAIITGKYKPGERLTEEALANELNISRTPIREAINKLKSDGLITPLKRGVIVREFSKKDIRQIYDLRSLLEGYAASQAALNRSEEDIRKMEKANETYKLSIDLVEDDMKLMKIPNIVEANQAFHQSMIKASQNNYIEFHLSKVVVLPLVFQSFYWYNNDEINRSYYVHETVLNAIKNQEPERARIAMQEHIYVGRDHVLKYVGEDRLGYAVE